MVCQPNVLCSPRSGVSANAVRTLGNHLIARSDRKSLRKSSVIRIRTRNIIVCRFRTYRVWAHVLNLKFSTNPVRIVWRNYFVRFSIRRPILGFTIGEKNHVGFFVLVVCFMGSGVSAALLYFITTSTQNLMLSAVFESLSSAGISLMYCIAVEIFPTEFR